MFFLRTFATFAFFASKKFKIDFRGLAGAVVDTLSRDMLK